MLWIYTYYGTKYFFVINEYCLCSICCKHFQVRQTTLKVSNKFKNYLKKKNYTKKLRFSRMGSGRCHQQGMAVDGCWNLLTPPFIAMWTRQARFYQLSKCHGTKVGLKTAEIGGVPRPLFFVGGGLKTDGIFSLTQKMLLLQKLLLGSAAMQCMKQIYTSQATRTENSETHFNGVNVD